MALHMKIILLSLVMLLIGFEPAFSGKIIKKLNKELKKMGFQILNQNFFAEIGNNAQDIQNNADEIDSNIAQIGEITVEIGNNALDIQNNADEIDSNIAHIDNNTMDIANLQYSDATQSAKIAINMAGIAANLASINEAEIINTKFCQTKWTVNCDLGVWNSDTYSNRCSNWYGYGSGNAGVDIGSISTIFSGSGRAKLDFGNCFFLNGTVYAYLDGNEIASASKETPSVTVEFDFNVGSILIITEVVGIIQFNSLDIIQCNDEIDYCQENTHVNNLLESTTTNTVSRWTIDCNDGVWIQTWKNCQNWYGWNTNPSEKVGSIVTTLSGLGRARLDFGNCHDTGTVKAFLDGQEIGSADALIPHKVVEFNFNPGSVLRMSEYDVAVIQFNNLEIIDCSSTEAECLSLGNSTYINDKCFYVEMGLFNYADAMVNCQNQFGSDNTGKLFEPKDSSTNDQVIEFAKEMILPSTEYLHIGINDIATEGTWQYATGGDLVYTNWGIGQPDNHQDVNGQDCGRTYTGTTWDDEKCYKEKPSICEMIKKAEAECLSLGNSAYINGKCFKVEMGLLNYADAMVNCQNQFGSDNTGKLFEPKDSSTNDQVIEFAKEMILPSTEYLHIGFNDITTEGTWQYATGGYLVYTNWGGINPNNGAGNGEDCGETYSGTTWNDGTCSGKQPSICEMI